MQKCHAAAILALFLSTAAHAETAWVGNAFVVAVQAPCGDTVAVGDFYTAIYRPAGAALGNGADSYFALVGQRSHFTMLVPNNTFAAGINYASQYVSSQVTFGSNVGGILNWSLAPAALDATVRYATLVFSITNFFKLKGCNPSFRANLELAL